MYLNEFDATLELIKGKWKPVLLYTLYQNPNIRYNELKRSIPYISHKTLSAQLTQLKNDGLIHRFDLSTSIPHIEYSLTEKGSALIPVLDTICEWGLKYTKEDLLKTTLCD